MLRPRKRRALSGERLKGRAWVTERPLPDPQTTRVPRGPGEASSAADRQRLARWFLGFFFVSGFCSLVYEVVWLRLAVARFGTTTPSVSAVLSIFMGGLAVGSWGGGRLSARLARRGPAAAIRLYGLAELVIALSGVAVPLAFDLGRRLLLMMGRQTPWESGAHHLAAGLCIALSLLPFCTAMGATFPLAMGALRATPPDGAGRSFSRLYLANVVGAAAGTLVSAFVLVELLGFSGTLCVAAALNVLLGVAAFGLSALVPGRPTLPAAEAAAGAAGAPAVRTGFALPALFLTGLISMAMEVAWIRQFTPYLGTVVYAFATILALYLAATFIGSTLYRRFANARAGRGATRDPSEWVWLSVGLAGLLPLAVADYRLPLPLGSAIDPFAAWGSAFGISSGAVRAALGLGPFCVATGWLTPMLVDRWSGGEPRRAGTAYAVNVVGGILGPLLAGFVLLPHLGERWTVVLLSIPLFGLGIAALSRRGAAAASASASSTRWAFGAAVSAGVLLTLYARDYSSRFLGAVVKRDYEATVIAAGEGEERRLLVNGVGITSLTAITKLMVHLPLAFRTAPPRNVLVICFGMGTTFRSGVSWGVQTTAVELVPSVPEFFGYYHSDAEQVRRSPLGRIVIDDGRRFLERTPTPWDLVTIDPPPPVEATTSSLLYSREFYALIRARLGPGGMVQQWMPGGDETIISSFTRALTESFPHVRAFPSVEGWGVHFLASMEPIQNAPAAVLAGRLPDAAARDLTEWYPGITPEQLFERMLQQEVPIASLLALDPKAPALTDDRPRNEYYVLRHALGAGG